MHDLSYDPNHIANEATRRHGATLGRIVAADEIKRRQEEDARHAELSTALPVLMERISDSQRAAGVAQADFAARREQLHATYAAAIRQLDQDAEQAHRQAQAAIVVLVTESQGMQREMTAIVIRREAERENRAVAEYNAPGMEAAREADRRNAAAAKPIIPGLQA
jgi:hypothetical protein